VSEGAVGGGETEGMELASSQQQSCECHVCTAPLTPVSTLLEIISLIHVNVRYILIHVLYMDFVMKMVESL
jgi:hypothetical protein